MGGDHKRMEMASRGFTLLELAVVLVIVSLMTGFGLQAFQGSTNTNCYEKSRQQLGDIRAAIDNFVRRNNRYPLPSGRSYGVTNPYFGKEYNSIADIDTSGAAPNRVLIGALPFAALGLNNSYSADCWGNKFSYAVTEKLTSTHATDGFPASGNLGLITVKNGTISSSNNITTAAAYVVLSHGEDALGASQRNYSGAKKNCNASQASGAVTRVDKENCDVNNTTFYQTAFNNGKNAPNYFDDLIAFSNKSAALGSCSATGISWGGGCTATTAIVAHGGTAVVNNTAGGYSGTANVSCTNGVLTTSGIACSSSASGCSATTGSWNTNCSGPVGALAHSGTESVSNTAANYTGSATATCNNGVVSMSAGTCYANCTGTSTVSWDTNCGASVGALNHGATSAVTNTNAGYTGSATATCTNGVKSTTGATTCYSNCTAATESWNTNCSGPVGALAHGAFSTISNTAGGYTGSVTITCTNGVRSQSAKTCTVIPSSDCSAGTVSWNGSSSGCSASVGAMLNGASTAGVANTASGKTGAATISCNSGTLSASSATCYSNCTSQSKTWLTNCSATVPVLSHGGTSALTNVNAGYTGTSTATCSNGTVSTSSNICKANCVAQSKSWLTNCSGPISALNHGAAADITNTASGYSGSAVGTCNNGNVNLSDRTCVAGCPAQSIAWNTNCSGTTGELADGASDTVANVASGYTGYVTATCNSGTISQSGATCAASGGGGDEEENCPPNKCYFNPCSSFCVANGATMADKYSQDWPIYQCVYPNMVATGGYQNPGISAVTCE